MTMLAAGRKLTYEKLLDFIDTTEDYTADRLFGMLPSEGEPIPSPLQLQGLS